MPGATDKFPAFRSREIEEIHVSKIVAGTAVVALVTGAVAGYYSGVLYSRQQTGLALLKHTYADAEQQIRIYEKLRELQSAGQYQRVADALDGQLEMARLSFRAAEMAMKEQRPADYPSTGKDKEADESTSAR
jgi:hypothetical protein